MPEMWYMLYDTAPFATTASTDHNLFQVAEGGDSTHVETYTNSRGAGALPTGEQFAIQRLVAWVDDDITEADYQKIIEGALIEVRVSDRTFLKQPLQSIMGYGAFSGHYTQASGADEFYMGLAGDGYELPIPIIVPGGTKFSVRVHQSVALSATHNVKVALEGTLVTP